MRLVWDKLGGDEAEVEDEVRVLGIDRLGSREKSFA